MSAQFPPFDPSKWDPSNTAGSDDLEKMLRALTARGTLGGMNPTPFPTVASENHAREQGGASAGLMASMEGMDTRGLGLSRHVAEFVAGSAKASEFEKNYGKQVGYALGAAINSPQNPYNAMMGGSQVALGYGLQSAFSQSYMSMGGAGFNGAGAGTNAAAAAVADLVQKKFFTGGGFVSKEGLDRTQLGALAQSMGENGMFKGISINKAVVRNGQLDLDSASADLEKIPALMSKTGRLMQAIGNITGSGNMVELMKTASGLIGKSMGTEGAIEQVGRRLSDIKMAASVSGMSESSALSAVMSTASFFTSRGMREASAGTAASEAYQRASAATAGTGGRVTMEKAMQYQTTMGGIHGQTGGSDDFLAAAQYAAATGDKGAQKFMDSLNSGKLSSEDIAAAKRANAGAYFRQAEGAGGIDAIRSSLSAKDSASLDRGMRQSRNAAERANSEQAWSGFSMGETGIDKDDLKLALPYLDDDTFKKLQEGDYDNAATAQAAGRAVPPEVAAAMDRLKGKKGLGALGRAAKSNAMLAPMTQTHQMMAAAAARGMLALNLDGFTDPANRGLNTLMTALVGGDGMVSDDEAAKMMSATMGMSASKGGLNALFEKNSIGVNTGKADGFDAMFKNPKLAKALEDAGASSPAALAAMSPVDRLSTVQSAMREAGYVSVAATGSDGKSDVEKAHIISKDFLGKVSKNGGSTVGMSAALKQLGWSDERISAEMATAIEDKAPPEDGPRPPPSALTRLLSGEDHETIAESIKNRTFTLDSGMMLMNQMSPEAQEKFRKTMKRAAKVADGDLDSYRRDFAGGLSKKFTTSKESYGQGSSYGSGKRSYIDVDGSRFLGADAAALKEGKFSENIESASGYVSRVNYLAGKAATKAERDAVLKRYEGPLQFAEKWAEGETIRANQTKAANDIAEGRVGPGNIAQRMIVSGTVDVNIITGKMHLNDLPATTATSTNP